MAVEELPAYPDEVVSIADDETIAPGIEANEEEVAEPQQDNNTPAGPSEAEASTSEDAEESAPDIPYDGSVLNVLVVGETQQGKSTLVRNLLEYAKMPEADVKVGNGNRACTINPQDYEMEVPLRSYHLEDHIGNNLKVDKDSYSDLIDFGEDDAKVVQDLPDDQIETVKFRFLDTPGLNDSEGRDMELMAGILGKAAEMEYVNAVIYVRKIDKHFGNSFQDFLSYFQRSMPSLAGGLIIVHSAYTTMKVEKFLREGKSPAELRRDAFKAATGLDLAHFFMDNNPDIYSPLAVMQSLNESHNLLCHIKAQPQHSVADFRLLKTPGMQSIDIHITNALLGLKRIVQSQLDEAKTALSTVQQRALEDEIEVAKMDRQIESIEKELDNLEHGPDICLGSKTVVEEYSLVGHLLMSGQLNLGGDWHEFDADCPIAAGLFASINGSATFFAKSSVKHASEIRLLKNNKANLEDRLDYLVKRMSHQSTLDSENVQKLAVGLAACDEVLVTTKKDSFEMERYPALRLIYLTKDSKLSRDDIYDFLKEYDAKVADLIYSDCGLESDLISAIVDSTGNLGDEPYHNPGIDGNYGDERQLGPSGKFAAVDLSYNNAASAAIRVDFLFDGPPIWRDEWFSPEYFEILTASRPLDGICLLMKDWPPEGDYRVSRWLEWVSFYEEILAPIQEHTIDLYVVFLYKAEKSHVQAVSATASTFGIRCFIVGDTEDEYISGVSTINSKALVRWAMTLVVDVRVGTLGGPPKPGALKGKELQLEEPLGEGDLVPDTYEEEPVLADLDEDDALLGVDLSGWKLEFEDDEEEEGEEPVPITSIDNGGDSPDGADLEAPKPEHGDSEDDVDPPDTVGEANGHQVQVSNARVRDTLFGDAPKKPMRLGDSHQFLRSVLLEIKVAYEEEIARHEISVAPMQASLHEVEDRLVSLYTDLGSFKERHGELSSSTKLICGRPVIRNHQTKLLHPCPRTFRFDEMVDFRIQGIKEVEITGRKDPKVWGVIPANPKRFVGNVKNDIYRSAKCEFHLMGYEWEVRAKEIKALAMTIQGLLEGIEACKKQRDDLKQELDIATTQASEIQARITSCDIDLDKLQDPASLCWNMEDTKRYLQEHNLYGITKEYGLCSLAKASFYNFNQSDLKEFKALIQSQETAVSQFSLGVNKLLPVLRDFEGEVEEGLEDIEQLTNGLELEPKHSTVIKKMDQELAQLEKKKRLWRPHFAELGSLATEAKEIMKGMESERMELLRATSALQNKVRVEASNMEPGATTEAAADALGKATLDLEILDNVKYTLDSDVLDVGAYATMKYQGSTKEGLVALHDGIASMVTSVEEERRSKSAAGL
ncbi:hypothetical protein Dda_8320 [Drechslerella dactyloides]|uniref:G domain-containing protein n=1 Tax=Drechslerella dactyloides TaxID=74499 RepID=A0AAD6IRV8_DREDA|nr:hypothetical protein Dda_8320 [Drechslerella dactyloides]